MKVILVICGFLSVVDPSKIGGRTLPEFALLIKSIASNSINYYTNQKRFRQPVSESVVFYCQNSTTPLSAVSLENVTFVTSPTQPWVFIIHGWTDSKDAYYIPNMVNGKLEH